MKSKYKKMTYEQLIEIVLEKDVCHECIDEEELLNIVNDRLQYGFYEQAKDFINILQKQRYRFDDGNNYWKNDCGSIIPLLDEQDIIDNFSYLLD